MRREANIEPEGKDEKIQKTPSIHRCTTTKGLQVSCASPGPPPDGGFEAWSMAIMGFFVSFNSWGFIQGFGAFQTHYATILPEEPSTISWIGSVQVFLLFLLGIPAGRAVDAGFFRSVFIAGLIMQLLGVFLTSISTKYWQILLAQGICQGVGNGLQYVPVMSLLSTYFSNNASFAIGIASTGTSIGGMILPVMVRQLLPRVGFAWTVRSLGFVMAFLGSAAAVVLKPRILPRQSGPLLEWDAFTERPFIWFCIAMFFNFWGSFFPFYYIGSYSRNILQLDYSTSISLLLIMNGVGVLGRILPNIIADRYLSPVTMILISLVISGVIIFSWLAVHSSAGLWIFASFYGFFGAGVFSLFPACLASLSPDLQKRGVRMGIGFSIAGLASLTGTPLGGVLVQTGHGNYIYAQIWAGASLLVAAMFLIVNRVATRHANPHSRCRRIPDLLGFSSGDLGYLIA